MESTKSKDSRDERPIEIYCPICGYITPINITDESLESLPREKKLAKLKALQRSDHPFYTCGGCSDPEGSTGILEVR